MTPHGEGPSRTEVELRDYVRDIPDFPRPGIAFKDITPMLLDPAKFAESEAQPAFPVVRA